MTYNLTTHMSRAVSTLAAVFPLDVSCDIVQALKDNGCQAVRLDIDTDSDITVRVGIMGIFHEVYQHEASRVNNWLDCVRCKPFVSTWEN